jgi:hypothetical protein
VKRPVSESGLEICFFIELGICRELHSGSPSSLRGWRGTGLRQRRSAAATCSGCSVEGLICVFLFAQGCPIRGLDVIDLYQ